MHDVGYPGKKRTELSRCKGMWKGRKTIEKNKKRKKRKHRIGKNPLQSIFT